ncbi:hypothetical protein D3C73_837720 [compost metagenome]|uniref:ABC-2 type transport system permease protein n=1 Tax=Paenibacillus jilunlii TaxID=682956 RepID=A0A1G9HBQ9_9BACL|nr:hypothetical protein [Paenibacillus jilunlii]KWX69617.1 hypothetical protein AML91_27820 [Paenibacillus jilunlii]SDL10451.1 hypothetical protein SAMN05216191_101790 [Paenibacillus jilunlii]
MLKLMKYDLKSKRERLLAFFVIMLLVQAGIWFTNSSMGSELITFHIITYAGFSFALLLIAFFSYFRYLQSYARRLLPVPTVQSVLSPLLLFWVLLLSVVAIAAVHFGIYILVYSSDFLPVNFWPVASWSVLNLLWTAGFELILLMFAVTLAKSLRVKGTIWIAIAVFMVVENGLSFMERQFWGSYMSALDNVFRFEVYDPSAVSSGLRIYGTSTEFLWPLLFEAVIGAVLIYVMTLLIQKRIET